MRRECFWTKMSPESEWKPKIHLGWSNSPLLPASWTNHDDYCKWPLVILTWQPHNKRRRKRSRNCQPPHLAASPDWNLLWNLHNATTSTHPHIQPTHISPSSWQGSKVGWVGGGVVGGLVTPAATSQTKPWKSSLYLNSSGRERECQGGDICLSCLAVQVVPRPILIIVHVSTVLHTWQK